MTEQTSANATNCAADGEIHEPHLGVFVLTEFVYCARAGLCAWETGHEEVDMPARSYFFFNPLYSLAEIEAALQRTVTELTWFMAGAAFSAALAAALAVLINPTIGLVAAVGVIWFLGFAGLRGIRAAQLNHQRKQALAGKLREPDPNSPDVQPIHWWDFIRAGFVTQSVHDRLVDSERNFSGRPDRFLRRGNTIIPVWRMPHYAGRLFPQNFIRMSAYCQLVQQSLGAGVECPYGITLFEHGWDGVAIPVTTQRKAELLEALRAAREIIEKSRRRHGPQPPSPSVCAHCPYGKPRIHVVNETEHVCDGKSLAVIPEVAANGRCYHSLCGDRFRWLPPHEDVAKKDLRSQV